MIRKIININRSICAYLRNLRFCRLSINQYYEGMVHKYINHNQIIVDVGGGKTSPIARFKNEYKNLTLIAVDISGNELESNTMVDKKIVADVTKKIPMRDGSANMVISSSVLEHFHGKNAQDNFIKNAKRVLKSGGYFIHVFPSKYAAFSIINQLLPKKLSRKLLYFAIPESGSTSGFPAYYQKCYYSGMKKLLIKNGFTIEHIECSYYQSDYFQSLFPAFIVSLVWDNFCWIFKIKNLCSYICVVARKK